MTLPDPYYQDDACTIYCGDCREILPLLPKIDLVLTDPPYGTGWVRGGGSVGEFKAKHEKPAWDVFATEWIGLCNCKQKAVFSPVGRLDETCNAVGLSRSISYYRKTNVRPGGIAREPIVISPPSSIGDFEAYNGDCPLHPCQKPIELMRWLVENLALPNSVILDPFMGSGTTLRAAKDLGRKAIGIEINPAYCEIAKKRLAQEVLCF